MDKVYIFKCAVVADLPVVHVEIHSIGMGILISSYLFYALIYTYAHTHDFAVHIAIVKTILKQKLLHPFFPRHLFFGWIINWLNF